MGGAILSQRQLTRTLLDRQALLERTRRPAGELVERLVGLRVVGAHGGWS